MPVTQPFPVVAGGDKGQGNAESPVALTRIAWSSEGRKLAVGDAKGGIHVVGVAEEVSQRRHKRRVVWSSQCPPDLTRPPFLFSSHAPVHDAPARRGRAPGGGPVPRQQAVAGTAVAVAGGATRAGRGDVGYVGEVLHPPSHQRGVCLFDDADRTR